MSIGAAGVMPAWLTSGSRRAVWLRGVLLALVVSAGLAPGLFTLPPIDRDESRFAQASRQMVNGDLEDWIVPKVGERVRLNKPPLIYWLQAGTVKAFGGGPESAAARGMWAATAEHMTPARTGGIGWYRLPSAVCAVLAAIVTWLLGRDMLTGRWRERTDDERKLGEVGAWLGGLFLGTCVMVLWDGRQARADQLLLLMTTLALWGLWRCRREMLVVARDNEASTQARPRWSSVLLLWLAVALGVLTKGPITPMLVVGTVIGLGLLGGGWQWAAKLRWWVGLVALLAIVGTWVVLVAQRIGFGTYFDIVFAETIGRSAEAAEGHWGPPGYHLVALPLVFWPASLFVFGAALWVVGFGDTKANETLREKLAAAGGFVGSLRARAACRGEVGLFLVAWVVPCWIVFEAVTTKLPHYTLTLYPALAIGCGWFVATVASGLAKYAASVAERAIVLIAIAAGTGAAVGSLLLLRASTPATTAHVAGGVIVLIAGSVTAWCLVGRRSMLAGGLAAVALVVSSSTLAVGVVLPSLRDTWLSPQAAAAIVASGATNGTPIALVRYQEDSLVFLAAGLGERVGVGAAPVWLDEHPGGIVVTTVDVSERESLFGYGSYFEEKDGLLGQGDGVHYNGGGRQWFYVARGDAARFLVESLAADRARRRAERGLPAGDGPATERPESPAASEPTPGGG